MHGEMLSEMKSRRNKEEKERQVNYLTSFLLNCTHTLLCFSMLVSCTECYTQCGGQSKMAAVQMLAALFHIHSIALSWATVHVVTHKYTYVHTQMHSCTQSRAADGKRKEKKQCGCKYTFLSFRTDDKAPTCCTVMWRKQQFTQIKQIIIYFNVSFVLATWWFS